MKVSSFKTYGDNQICAEHGCGEELPEDPDKRTDWWVKFSMSLCPEHNKVDNE